MKSFLLAATLILALAAPAIAAKNPNGVAVIIGNKTYQGDIPAVDYAHNDADAIRRYVLDVLGYDPENIIDLRDASKAEMEAAFGNDKNPKGRLWQYLDPKGGSDVLVYYSGHGVPGQNDKRSFMLPANADPAFAEINGYPLDVLYKNLGKLKARSKTVLIDACFSGASPRGMLIDAASPVFIKAKQSDIGEGITVLTAASGDQLASWDKEAKYGLFTNHFLDAVYGKGDVDGDGRVTAVEIKTYLDDKMTRAARRTYRRVQQATLIGEGGRVLASYSPGQPYERTRVVGVEPEIKQVASLPPQKAAFTVTYLDEELVALKKSNVRPQPTTRSNILVSLDRGESIKVTGQTTVNGSSWYRVALAYGQIGYVHGDLLGEKIPTSQEIGDGLSIENVKSVREYIGGKEVLVVRGEIANVSDRIRSIPLLELRLFDLEAKLIQSTQATPRKQSLVAGDKIGFKIQLEEPNALAKELEITFVEPFDLEKY